MNRQIPLTVALRLCLVLMLGCGGPKSDPLPARLNDPEYVRDRLARGTMWKDGEERPINEDELLIAAVRPGYSPVETVTLLLENGANPNARESLLDKTPLFLAAYNGDLEIVNALIAAGADANALDRFGNNALREAIVAGHHHIINVLLKAGANPSQVNQDGESMAALAAKYGTAEIREAFAPRAD